MPATAGGGYKFLEHVTDAYIEAWGGSLEEAFARAAEGFYETMLNLSSVEPKNEEIVKVGGHDEKELLYEWLEALLLKFDIDGMVYSQFDIDPISVKSKPLTLQAKVKGEKYDPDKHGVKEEVKGITYHLMEIDKKPKGVTIRFVLDL